MTFFDRKGASEYLFNTYGMKRAPSAGCRSPGASRISCSVPPELALRRAGAIFRSVLIASIEALSLPELGVLLGTSAPG